MWRPDNVAEAASIIRFECAVRQFVRATVIATPIAFEFWLDLAAKKKPRGQTRVKLGDRRVSRSMRGNCG